MHKRPSTIHPCLETNPQQLAHARWCQALIHLRKSIPALGTGAKGHRIQVGSHAKSQLLIIHRRAKQGPEALILLGFHHKASLALVKLPKGNWESRLDSGTFAAGDQEELLAPSNLTVQNVEQVSLKLPPYPAWIFLKSD